MILKGSQRGSLRRLARHLRNELDNDFVEVIEVRGFLSEDMTEALIEVKAMARGTKCRQPVFSLSMNPPGLACASNGDFRAAADKIEKRLGLTGQPRLLVAHEKNGRRHCHAEWSRIDAENMTAINLPFFKTKLRTLSREFYLEYGWPLPPGLVDKSKADPLNYTECEFSQSKRAGVDPKAVKAIFQDCWAHAQSLDSFAAMLRRYGYHLARGDKRGFVAVDFTGEVLSVSRYASVRAKELRGKFGDPDRLPSVAEVKHGIGERITKALEGHMSEARSEIVLASTRLEFARTQMLARHRNERVLLYKNQAWRWRQETNMRAARLSHGLRGLGTGLPANIPASADRMKMRRLSAWRAIGLKEKPSSVPSWMNAAPCRESWIGRDRNAARKCCGLISACPICFSLRLHNGSIIQQSIFRQESANQFWSALSHFVSGDAPDSIV